MAVNHIQLIQVENFIMVTTRVIAAMPSNILKSIKLAIFSPINYLL